MSPPPTSPDSPPDAAPHSRDRIEDWAEVQALLSHLLDLPVAQRDDTLQASGAAPRIIERVRAMLSALDDSPDYLERGVSGATAAPTASIATGTRIGAWSVERLLGRGGMGEVYLAARADGAFEQQVAIKLVSPEAIAHLERFHAERRILAQLQHPGIARLLDGGVAPDARPYMVMEYVDGDDLVRWCTAQNANVEQRLALFGQVCEAVRYAHSRLVVHRDIKPRNVLVDRSGRVKLLDFGVARLLDTGVANARTQNLLTPEYASPEQLEGEAVSLATDVYGLGLLLFELLTGTSPWRNADSAVPTLVRRILEGDPPAPSLAAAKQAEAPVPPSRLRGDLDAIVLKALRREPALRYETVSLLQQDLQRHLTLEPVQARSGDRGYRLRRLLRRHRLVAAMSAALIVSLLAGIAGVAWQARVAQRERDVARDETRRVTAVRDYLSLMFRQSADAERKGDALSARELLQRSAQDLQQQFDGEPAARLEIMKTLAHLFAATGDPVGSATLLQAYLADPVLSDGGERAEAQFNLALQQYQLGEHAESARLLAQAQMFWSAHSPRYRQPLTQSRGLQADLLENAGDDAAAIEVMRNALGEMHELFGDTGLSTVNTYTRLGGLLTRQDRGAEALQLLQQGWQRLGDAGRQDSREGQSLLGSLALACFGTGDLAKAESLQRDHVQRSERLYGESPWLSGALSNLGKTLVREGRASEALPLLERARAMSLKITGPNSPTTLLAQINQAEALAQLHRGDEAQALLDATLPVIEQKLGKKQRLYTLGLLAQLRLALLRGDAAMVRKTREAIAALGPLPPLYQRELRML